MNYAQYVSISVKVIITWKVKLLPIWICNLIWQCYWNPTRIRMSHRKIFSSSVYWTPNFNRCQSIYYLTNRTFENNLQLNPTVGIEIRLGFGCLIEPCSPPSKKITCTKDTRACERVVCSNGRVGFCGRRHIKVRLKMLQLMSLNKDVQAPRYTIRILASYYCVNLWVLALFE
jgi:hypothetical protein